MVQIKKISTLKLVVVTVIMCTFMITGCTTIPKETIELSKEIGNGLTEGQRSYTSLLNTYFASKKQQVDQWIEKDYLPAYISNIQDELKKAGQSTTLTPNQLTDVLRDVIAERDQKHTDLENTRLLLLTKSNEHYELLGQGNASVTGLLQSMVDKREATASATQTIKSISGGKIDVEQIEGKFDQYLRKVGAASSKATNLYEAIKSTFVNKGE